MASTVTTRVTVLVRQGCHLCDVAQATVARVCAEAGVSWKALDVDMDAELRTLWTDHVPVVLIDGHQFSMWFVDGDKLRAALRPVA